MPYHDNIPIWIIDLSIIGPVKVNHRLNFHTRKELEHSEPFYSDITINPTKNGFNAKVTAFAPNANFAQKAALFFFGRMLDILSFRLNLPLQVDFSEKIITPVWDERIKRIIDINDFRQAFNEARLLSLTETTFLRALGYFRKGKYTQDPLDKFLALWNAIETVASKYNPNRERCGGNGGRSKCHIWECFKKVWGECEFWEYIPGQNDWIDNCYNIRVGIAHGTEPIEIDFIDKVLSQLENIENMSYKFLYNWRTSELNPTITEEIRNRLT